MKKKILAFLWVMAVLLCAYVGFELRYTNDVNNKSVIVYSKFKEVKQLEKDIKKKATDIMKEQKNCGISHTLIDADELILNIKDLQTSKVKPILNIKSKDNLKDCEKLTKDYKIKYVNFDGQEILGYPKNIDKTAKVIKDNKLIFMVQEKLNQIGIEDKKGQKELIEKTDYSINRLYKINERQLSKLGENDLFYRLERGVIDRNIRFIEVNQLKTPNMSVKDNYEAVNRQIEAFNKFIANMGYTTNKDLVKLNSAKLNDGFYFLIMIILTITCIRYIKELITLKWTTLLCTAITILLVFSYIGEWGLNVEKSLALVTSILFCCLSSYLVLKMTKENTKRVMLKSILKMLGINILGGYVIVACLSSLEYTMNIDMFRGVKVAFIIPILMYIVNFIIVYEIKLKDIIQYIKSKDKTSVILTATVVVFVIAVYILRNGNFKILSASKLELKVREALESFMGIRPRTKEFLFGYPLIMLFVYFRDSKSKLLKFILGLGTVICGVSIENSFCHVFTAIEVSMTRCIYGVTLGVLIGWLLITAWKNPNIRFVLTNNKLVKKVGALYNGNVNTKN